VAKGLDSVSPGVKPPTPFAAAVTFPLLQRILQQAPVEAAAHSCGALAAALLAVLSIWGTPAVRYRPACYLPKKSELCFLGQNAFSRDFRLVLVRSY